MQDNDPNALLVSQRLQAIASRVLKYKRMSSWDVGTLPAHDQNGALSHRVELIAAAINDLAKASLMRPIKVSELNEQLENLKAVDYFGVMARDVYEAVAAIESDRRVAE